MEKCIRHHFAYSALREVLRTSLPTVGRKEPYSSGQVLTTSRACSAPYRHVNFLKIIAIKWNSSYTVGSVIDH